MRRVIFRGTALLMSASLLWAMLLETSAPRGPVRQNSLPVPHPFVHQVSGTVYGKPPTTAQCAREGDLCYSPFQMQSAYDMQPLYNNGLTGKGMTIAIVDSFGSPTIAKDLAHFDSSFGLRAPPSFKIITPTGHIPTFNPSGPDRNGWAVETSLDVEYAHAMAPSASILLVETPVDETIGTKGFPQIVRAENYVINHHLAQVISQSFGAAEQTFPSKHSLLALRSAYINAKRHNVTVLASSGDNGPTSSSDNHGHFFDRRVANWPASDPLVTAVGGTKLHLNAKGARTQPDTVWNDSSPGNGPAASAGGLSVFFGRPAYQDSVTKIVGSHRGYPDISMSAAQSAGAIVYVSFRGTHPGFEVIGGTSWSCPLLSGIIAVADQAAGHGLGLINPVLYRLGAGSHAIPDITRGNTNVSVKVGNHRVRIQGYQAARGYDLATGLGTVDGAKLVAALKRG